MARSSSAKVHGAGPGFPESRRERLADLCRCGASEGAGRLPIDLSNHRQLPLCRRRHPGGDGVEAYLTAFANNLISAGIRLVPLGQSDGLRIVITLEPRIIAYVQMQDKKNEVQILRRDPLWLMRFKV